MSRLDDVNRYGSGGGISLQERIADARAFLAGRPLEASRQEMARKWLKDIFETEVVRAVPQEPTPRCVDCWQPDEDTDLNGRCYECAREAAADFAAERALDDEMERRAEAREDARRTSCGGFPRD